jgi:peptidoglycan hydrolase-like protein with peptidoglycan-binding domain
MNNLQRVLGLLFAIVFFTPVFASAQVSVTGNSTVDVQIQALLSQINALQQQLHSLVLSSVPTSTPAMWNASSTPPHQGDQGGGQGGQGMGGCPSFVRNLSVGSRGDDVTQLQTTLSDDGFLNASSTGFFGQLTARALLEFQMHFGITSSSTASGFFGPLTRDFLGAHCGNGQGNDQGQGGGQGGGEGPRGMMGSSTPPMWQPASTTLWMNGANGGVRIGSSTPPRPCPQGDQNGAQGAAAVLFVPHAILPPNPCAWMASSTMTQ